MKRKFTIKLLIVLITLLVFICIIVKVVYQDNRIMALDNGLALTPPMGWNSWNKFGGDVSENIIKEIADAMVSSGMRDVGYQYIIIDDMWSSKERDSKNNLVPDSNKFPNGIKALADYVHSRGLKIGIYGDRGTATCCGLPGSQGYEIQDANTFASWGIDYLKYDNCNADNNLQAGYETMRDALTNTGRPIVYSICCWYFLPWCPDTGNLWRTTSDIKDNWSSITSIIDINSELAEHAGPGHWNDPDMLEVGNGGMSDTEYKAHFGMWSIMSSPLIAGNDLRNMSQSTIDILTNDEIIAINQDKAGIQGIRVVDNGNLEVWCKPLELANGNKKAVALFNRSESTSNITVNWSDIGISGNANVRDLWKNTDVGKYNDKYSTSVPPHGVVILKITAENNSNQTSATVEITPSISPSISPGDVNLDGKINITDALLVAQYYVGHIPDNFHKENMDVNSDGIINIQDALLISQYYVGIIISFPNK